MTTPTPLERAVAILTEGEFYRSLPNTLVVASVSFKFAAVLVGVANAPDLIIVVDTVTESNELRLRQQIQGLGRALDVAGSRRPITAVLVGPKPSILTLEAISRVCRVLPVGTPTGEDAEGELRDWLAVLLPLSVPTFPMLTVADSGGELGRRVLGKVDDSLYEALFSVAGGGKDAVRKVLEETLAAPLAGVVKMGEDSL